MSVAHFKLLYHAERSSVSISIEDKIPKPFLKVGDKAFELECYLKQSIDLQYQIFEDDEPKQWGYLDTSEHAATYGIIDMQTSKSPSDTQTVEERVLEPLCIKPELSNNEKFVNVNQASPSDGSLPDFGHSDTETESSELDAPLTPDKAKGFLEAFEGSDDVCLLECKDIKDDYGKDIKDDYGKDIKDDYVKNHGCPELSDTLYINKLSAMPNTNTREVDQLLDGNRDHQELADGTSLSFSTDCQDHHEDNQSVSSDNAKIPEEDEFDDRCVVDDMVAEMQEKGIFIADQKAKAMSSQQAQLSLQHMPKMSTSDLLKLEPMFASFIMIIVLQVFANAFSFTKAYTN